MNRLRLFWLEVWTSFWFTPSLLVASSIALAAGLVSADSALTEHELAQWPRLFGAGPEGARQMMATIAGAMMSVLGVLFSMILVVLVLASSQYTSRILRNFMRSRVTQAVLGIFAGIFSYALIVLRTIRSPPDEFVPSFAVFFGLALALFGVGALMYFIHHIATSIQATHIVAGITEETAEAIDRLFPEPARGDQTDAPQPPEEAEREWRTVPADHSGFVQAVETAALVRVACELKTVVRMVRAVGEFVVEGTPLVQVAAGAELDEAGEGALRRAFTINSRRTVEQDPGFGVRQIVDIALKALSPGINDPTTAATCVDHLTVILARLAGRRTPPRHLLEEGSLRVITRGLTFERCLFDSFDELRRSLRGEVSLVLQLLESLRTLGSLTTNAARRAALRQQVDWTAELAGRTVSAPQDRSRVDARLAEVRAALR